MNLMKWPIEFTKNWKHRDLLHIVGGILIGLIIRDVYVTIIACALIGHIWETKQMQHFEATYSIKDVLLTILGGGLISIIL